MKLIMESWRAIISEQSKYDKQFKTLMDAGYAGIKEALFLANSLGMPTQDLPWDLDTVAAYLFYKKQEEASASPTGVPKRHPHSIRDEALAVTGWDLDDYFKAEHSRFEEEERSLGLRESTEHDSQSLEGSTQLPPLPKRSDETFALVTIFLGNGNQGLHLARDLKNPIAAEFEVSIKMIHELIQIAANPNPEYDETEETKVDHLTTSSIEYIESILLRYGKAPPQDDNDTGRHWITGGVEWPGPHDSDNIAYEKIEESIDGVSSYWSYELAVRPPQNPFTIDAVNSFNFMKKWVGMI